MDDEEFFKRSMASLGVEALDGNEHGAGSSAERRFAEVEGQMFRQAIKELDGVPPEVSSDEPRHQQASVRRLKASSKMLRLEDQIDLHRLRSVEALRRLEVFVHRNSASRARNILVITGKGHHSPGGRGVLRERVEEWIQGPGRRYVSTYAPAPRAQGGRGAFVLSLRHLP